MFVCSLVVVTALLTKMNDDDIESKNGIFYCAICSSTIGMKKNENANHTNIFAIIVEHTNKIIHLMAQKSSQYDLCNQLFSFVYFMIFFVIELLFAIDLNPGKDVTPHLDTFFLIFSQSSKNTNEVEIDNVATIYAVIFLICCFVSIGIIIYYFTQKKDPSDKALLILCSIWYYFMSIFVPSCACVFSRYFSFVNAEEHVTKYLFVMSVSLIIVIIPIYVSNISIKVPNFLFIPYKPSSIYICIIYHISIYIFTHLLKIFSPSIYLIIFLVDITIALHVLSNYESGRISKVNNEQIELKIHVLNYFLKGNKKDYSINISPNDTIGRIKETLAKKENIFRNPNKLYIINRQEIMQDDKKYSEIENESNKLEMIVNEEIKYKIKIQKKTLEMKFAQILKIAEVKQIVAKKINVAGEILIKKPSLPNNSFIGQFDPNKTLEFVKEHGSAPQTRIPFCYYGTNNNYKKFNLKNGGTVSDIVKLYEQYEQVEIIVTDQKGKSLPNDAQLLEDEYYHISIAYEVSYYNEDYALNHINVETENLTINAIKSSLKKLYKKDITIYVDKMDKYNSETIIKPNSSQIIAFPVDSKLKFLIQYPDENMVEKRLEQDMNIQHFKNNILHLTNDCTLTSSGIDLYDSKLMKEIFIESSNIITIKQNKMNIIVVTPKNEEYQFVFPFRMKINRIKLLLGNRFKFGDVKSPEQSAKEFDLVFQGRILQDNSTFEDYSIKSDSKIQIVPKNKELHNQFKVYYIIFKLNDDMTILGYPFNIDPTVGSIIRSLENKENSKVDLFYKDVLLSGEPDKHIKDFKIPPDAKLSYKTVSTQQIPPQEEEKLIEISFQCIFITPPPQLGFSTTFSEKDTVRNINQKLGHRFPHIIFQLQKNKQVINDDVSVLTLANLNVDIVEVKNYVFKLSIDRDFRLAYSFPINTTVYQAKEVLNFNGVSPLKYLDFKLKNNLLSDDTQLLDKLEISAAPKDLKIKFVFEQKLLHEAKMKYNFNFNHIFYEISKKLNIPETAFQLMYDHTNIISKNTIFDYQIVDGSIITVTYKPVDFNFYYQNKIMKEKFLYSDTIPQIIKKLSLILKVPENNLSIPKSRPDMTIIQFSNQLNGNPILIIQQNDNEEFQPFNLRNMSNGETHKVEFPINTTIEQVRSYIAETIYNEDEIDENITIMFAGKALNNFQTLKNLNIPKDGIIQFTADDEDDEEYLKTVTFPH